MKKLLTSIALILSLSISYAHTLTRTCWIENRYGINITQGDANGKIEITTYTNSNRTTVIEATRTFLLNNNGAVSNVTVSQPNRNTTVFVYVRWFSRNSNGTYSPVSWNSGQGYANSYSSIQTSTNQCSVVALNDYNIDVSVSGNLLTIRWNTMDYDSAQLEQSLNSVNFTEQKAITNTQTLVIEKLVQRKSYFRIHYYKNGNSIYSNVKLIDFKLNGINFMNPYVLNVYTMQGQLLNVYTNKTQYQLQLKGEYILFYSQKQKDTIITETIHYFKQ